MTNSAVSSIAPSEVDWVGTLEPQYYGQYFDYGMLLIFGGIPWQVSVVHNKNKKLSPFLVTCARVTFELKLKLKKKNKKKKWKVDLK